MNLNFRELEYFVAIAEQNHFGRAAKAVNVSQPTLSMQFKKFEERLGGDLIERLPRDAILTALGAEVLPIARQILRLAADIASRCDAKENHGRLRLGVIPTISPYLLPKISRALRRGIQGRKISLSEAQTADLIRLVRDGTIDAAILSTPLKERGIEEVEIFSEPFYLAVNTSHPMARRRKLSLADLKNEKLLLLEEGHCMRNQALSICNLPQVGNDTDLSATSIETLRNMVAMGAGVTLIPKLAIRKGDDVSYVPFSESGAVRTVGIIYRPSSCEKAFINLLVDIIKGAAQREKMEVVGREAAVAAAQTLS